MSERLYFAPLTALSHQPENVFDEWIALDNKMESIDNLQSDNLIDFGENRCICSRVLKNAYFTYNIENQNIVLMGSSCWTFYLKKEKFKTDDKNTNADSCDHEKQSKKPEFEPIADLKKYSKDILHYYISTHPCIECHQKSDDIFYCANCGKKGAVCESHMNCTCNSNYKKRKRIVEKTEPNDPELDNFVQKFKKNNHTAFDIAPYTVKILYNSGYLYFGKQGWIRKDYYKLKTTKETVFRFIVQELCERIQEHYEEKMIGKLLKWVKEKKSAITKECEDIFQDENSKYYQNFED